MQNNLSFSVLCSSGVKSESFKSKSFKSEGPLKHYYKSSVSVRKTDIETDSEANPAPFSKRTITNMRSVF